MPEEDAAMTFKFDVLTHVDPEMGPQPTEDWTYIHPMALAVLPTYRCTAACEHCCFDSNPTLTQRIDLATILDAIERVSHYPSMKLVSFTGGECFLLGRELDEAVAFATSKGLRTRCVTNAYWARSFNAGQRRLRKVVDAGLQEISISTGDNHLKFVALESVINATISALEFGLKTDVVVEVTKHRSVKGSDVSTHPRLQQVSEEKRKRLDILESPWMPMHHEKVIDQPGAMLLNRDNVSNFKGCDSILTTLALTPYNRIGLCCGLSRELIPELTVDQGDFETILKTAGNDFMKIWLSVDGPERILAWAASKDPTIDWEEKYAHRCHACLALHKDPKVVKAIRENYRERMGDVLLRHGMNLQRQGAILPTLHA
jgi:organic radical activating enzyme